MQALEHEAGPFPSRLSVLGQRGPSGLVGAVESLAPVFKIRPTDQATAGSEVPQSRALGRTGRGAEGVLEKRGWL